MAKVKVEEHGGENYVMYACPGCKYDHAVPAKRWNWNGSVDAPTLSPSVRHYTLTESGEQVTTCHYHVRGGMIEFCNDCQHELKGKKVPLPDVGSE